ncbi:iron complex transport system substrate-binding protein [Methanophagales archaeon]|nr:iron complex transport system substrate-binding protein [Methanophagales archaeon]
MGKKMKKMKNENKILALVEMAIVICSLFLVALPAIAAEQTLQKASASKVTTASEDDFVLGIYGNANEDDTIDMRDLTYVKLIFFGERSETELADAKYDDEINPLDFVQIKLIIVGKEKELTLLQYMGYPPDFTEKAVTVPMPIERIVVVSSYAAEAVCAFGTQDRIVGVADYTKNIGELNVFLKDKPSVGKGCCRDWDIEKIIELKPDIVLAFSFKSFPNLEEPLNAADIPLVQVDIYQTKKYSREIRNLGWLMDNKDRAEELIHFEQRHIDLIKERVDDLKPEEKTRVYYCSHAGYYGLPTHTSGKSTAKQTDIELCGGINIFDDLEGHYEVVDSEAVIIRNPQVIFADTWCGAATGALGYDITDTSSVEKVRTKTIMNYPGFDHIDAVKNGRVYFVSSDASSTHHCIWLSYMAKYFYPVLFEDVDPVEIHREWLETFLGIKYRGVYAYPTYPVS